MTARRPRRPHLLACTAVRILVLTNMYPPHSYGGYELSCRDVVDRWRRQGHEVSVLTSDVRVPEAEGWPDEPGVDRRLRIYWRDHRILDPPPLTRLRWERVNRAALDDMLGRLRPDVVSAWAMGAMSLGLLTTCLAAGLPLVPVVCDEWPAYGPDVDAWMRVMRHHRGLALLAGLTTGLPTALPDLDDAGPACFVSAHLLAKVRAAAPWSFPGALVVPSGIAAEEFTASRDEPRPWGWRLLYAGRIDPRKGIDTAVRALALLPGDATLAIHGSGDGEHRAELEALARDLGVASRLSFAVTPRSMLAAVYRSADALVFPSSWDEPFGLVPIEAMACGTPVVATMAGGASEFLADGGNCLAFRPGDADGLAAALRRLAADEQLRARLRSGGLATAGELTVDRVADRLLDQHRHAAGRRAGFRDDGSAHRSATPKRAVMRWPARRR